MHQTPWPLRGSHSFTMESEVVGDHFSIGVWQPQAHIAAPASNAPLRLVYVLDGSFMLPCAATVGLLQAIDLIRPGFERLLLVGIDYPEQAENARIRDYCPPDSLGPALLDKMASLYPEGVPASVQPGGATRFLRFIQEELDPLIRERYPIQPGPAGLLGDSAGGCFAAWCFTQQCALFDRYWLGSPALYDTPTDYAGQFAERLKQGLLHETRLYLSLGELEATGGVNIYEQMGEQFQRLQAALQQHAPSNLHWAAKTYPGLTHTSVFLPSINDAMQFLFGPQAS